MNKSKKAQGSLETLILIGGAIIIAITIIAIVISLSGSSRDSISDQGEDIQSITEGPIAPTITNVEARYLDCIDDKENSLLRFSWSPISLDGTFRLIIEDSRGNIIGNLNYAVYHNMVVQYMNNLDPYLLNNLMVANINIGN